MLYKTAVANAEDSQRWTNYVSTDTRRVLPVYLQIRRLVRVSLLGPFSTRVQGYLQQEGGGEGGEERREGKEALG